MEDSEPVAAPRAGPMAWLPPRVWLHGLRAALAAQEDRYGLWLPVAFAVGAGGYFALPVEPADAAVVASGLFAMALLASMIWRQRINWPVLLAVFVLLGAIAGKVHVAMTDTHLLQATSGTVTLTGVVRERQRLGKRWRVVIDLESVDGLKDGAAPQRVRITAPASYQLPRGERLKIKARLYPLPGPVAPGAWNPARGLWFAGIGATGYSLSKPQILPSDDAHAVSGFNRTVQNLRDAIAGRIRAILPPGSAGMAIALITGERGEIPNQARDDLRASGLAHILAISGLHMSLVAGGIFWVVRALLALSPWLAAGFPIKKWAVVVALVAAAGYLALSGAAVATQRAFVMLAVMGLAVLLDRPAISMRNLAVAAFVVMILSPEAVTGASFQMSFLAVASLIAFYETVSAWRQTRDVETMAGGRVWQVARWAGLFIIATAATTLVAGSATALPAAFHFHRVSFYSLIANVLGLPVVSFIVMPAAVLSVFAMPFGLEAAPLWLMGKGIDIVLWVADHVASMPGSSHFLPAFPAAAAIVMAAGILWLALWRRRIRKLGLAIFASGLAMAPWKTAPDVLIDRYAGVVAIRNAGGKLVPSNGRKGRYVTGQWLMADGDATTPSDAAHRMGWTCGKARCTGAVKGQTIVYLMDEKADTDCAGRQIVIADFPLHRQCSEAAVRIDRFDVWRNGAHALYVRGSNIRMETARQTAGNRPWNVIPVARASIRTTPPSLPSRKTAPRSDRNAADAPKDAAQ